MESVRLDRWLGAARVFKSRTRASQACDAGRVHLNAQRARARQLVRPGDEIEVRGEHLRVFEVVALADHRLSPAQARELYVDHSPEPVAVEKREEPFSRERGTGRPTKRDRRRLGKLRGRE